MTPYNTRRKSLSLSELGIVVPKRSRANEQHPSPPETVVEGEEPPVKRSKRAHESETPPLGLMSPPRTTSIRIKDEKRKSVSALSPPPSPATEGINTVDTEGINDDIVVATIHQLERTGNRPHLVKELAAMLANNVHTVEKCASDSTAILLASVANRIARSANPCALISSRLTAYLHRPWPAISPCPLAKDLSSVHPRRLYFFLTTMPRQPIPDVAEPLPKASRIISPSLSSASADDEDVRYARGRQAMSPSPEVDLSSPDLDDSNPNAPPTPGGSFSIPNPIPNDTSIYAAAHRRASPPLEHEERDFKQTASQLYEQAQARRSSQQDVSMGGTGMETAAAASATGMGQDSKSVAVSIEADESEESAARKNSEAAVALFGAIDHLRLHAYSSALDSGHMDFSSPVIQPLRDVDGEMSFHSPLLPIPAATSSANSNADVRASTSAAEASTHRDELMEPMALDLSKDSLLPNASLAWDEDLQSPENIELEELETMFDAY